MTTAQDQVTSQTDANGATTTWSYSGDDGQRTEMSDGTGSTDYSYDANDRLAGVTNGAWATTSYAYDPAGLLTTIAYPNGQNVTRGYNGAGRLTWSRRVAVFSRESCRVTELFRCFHADNLIRVTGPALRQTRCKTAAGR